MLSGISDVTRLCLHEVMLHVKSRFGKAVPLGIQSHQRTSHSKVVHISLMLEVV